MQRARFGFVAALLAALAGPAGSAEATTRTWPGAVPCDGTLQACVDAADAGDVVEIATAGPILEDVSFEKPLTLRAQAGAAPRFGGFHSVIGGLASGSGTVRIEGLAMTQGSIRIYHASPGALVAEIVGNTVEDVVFGGPALEVYASGSGTPGAMTAVIAGNSVTVPAGDQTGGIAVSSFPLQPMAASVTGNTVAMGSNMQGAAIGIWGQGSIDVFSNAVSGQDFNTGIGFYATGGGTVRVFNNLVSGQSGNSGAPSAIVVHGNEHTIEALIGNNTLVENETGVFCTARDDLGGYLEGGVRNNLFVGNQRGFVRDAPFAASLPDSYNLFHANVVDVGYEEDPEVPGPSSVFAAPIFVAGYHLRADSPGVDHGDPGFVPQDLPSDIEGNPRVAGVTVDIGAYEVFVPEPGGAALAAAAALLTLARASRCTSHA